MRRYDAPKMTRVMIIPKSSGNWVRNLGLILVARNGPNLLIREGNKLTKICNAFVPPKRREARGGQQL